eukprot:6174856-Pleurochrysis_carterae.AAC.4
MSPPQRRDCSSAITCQSSDLGSHSEVRTCDETTIPTGEQSNLSECEAFALRGTYFKLLSLSLCGASCQPYTSSAQAQAIAVTLIIARRIFFWSRGVREALSLGRRARAQCSSSCQ